MNSTIKSYFKRKKGHLSDKSNNEERQKKATKSSLNLSLKVRSVVRNNFWQLKALSKG